VITAFNFPMAVWAWNAALALVCGDSVLWKPSEKTPLCAAALAGLLDDVAAGFDAAAVRLTGNVVGQPPFTGTLTHRGWRVTEIRLPRLAEGHDVRVLAPAEVEL
jgi:delta 1-pyrroline-5-carboxylate dehydrogenase